MVFMSVCIYVWWEVYTWSLVIMIDDFAYLTKYYDWADYSSLTISPIYIPKAHPITDP